MSRAAPPSGGTGIQWENSAAATLALLKLLNSPREQLEAAVPDQDQLAKMRKVRPAPLHSCLSRTHRARFPRSCKGQRRLGNASCAQQAQSLPVRPPRALRLARQAANDGRDSLKRLLRTYGAVPSSLLGGNYEMWTQRFNASVHSPNFPGGSDSGLGWTYLRYPHVASTVWAALVVMYQFDEGSPVREMANPYVAPAAAAAAPAAAAPATRCGPLLALPRPWHTRPGHFSLGRWLTRRFPPIRRCATAHPRRQVRGLGGLLRHALLGSGHVPRQQARARPGRLRSLPRLCQGRARGRLLPFAQRQKSRLLRHSGLV